MSTFGCEPASTHSQPPWCLVVRWRGDGPSSMVRWVSTPFTTETQSQAVPPLSAAGRSDGHHWIRRADLPSAAPSRCRRADRRRPAAGQRRVPHSALPRDESFSDASTLHFVSSLTGCGFNPPACFASCSPAVDEWASELAGIVPLSVFRPADSPGLAARRRFVFSASDPRSPSAEWRDITGIDVKSGIQLAHRHHSTEILNAGMLQVITFWSVDCSLGTASQHCECAWTHQQLAFADNSLRNLRIAEERNPPHGVATRCCTTRAMGEGCPSGARYARRTLPGARSRQRRCPR